jgi:hypothetical protein
MTRKPTLECMAIAVCLTVGSANAAFAEKIKFSYTKTARQTLSSSTASVGNASSHELVQAVHIDTIGKSGPGITLVDEKVYEQDEQIGGSGTHRGHSVNSLNDGERLFQRWEGTHNTVVKDAGSWEMTYSGKSEIIGGTGRYKNAKGNCNYKGRAAPGQLIEEDECAMEY